MRVNGATILGGNSGAFQGVDRLAREGVGCDVFHIKIVLICA